MSCDAIKDEIRAKVLENEDKFRTMGNLQRSINRSLVLAKNIRPPNINGENIFDDNEFYMDMIEKMKEMNVTDPELSAYLKEKLEDTDSDESESVLSDVVTAIKRSRTDPEILRQIEAVIKMEEQMDSTYLTLAKEKADRMEVQRELYDLIEREDNLHSKTKVFKELCDAEMGIKTASNENGIKNENTEGERERIRSDDGTATIKDNKFIKRNIELAKNTPVMGSYCLTDEEKVKLDSLLSDLDECDDAKDSGDNSSKSDRHEPGRAEDNYDFMKLVDEEFAFKPSSEDLTRLADLDQQLTSLSSEDSKIQLDNNNDSFYADASDWRDDLRLKQIDEQLRILEFQRNATQNLLDRLKLLNSDDEEGNGDFYIKQTPLPETPTQSGHCEVNDNDEGDNEEMESLSSVLLTQVLKNRMDTIKLPPLNPHQK